MTCSSKSSSSSASIQSRMQLSQSVPYFLNDQYFLKVLTDDSASLNQTDIRTNNSQSGCCSTATKSPIHFEKVKIKSGRSKSRSKSKLAHNKTNCYTIAGRTQQNSRQFSKFHYQPVGTFLTQYKIRENYKFLQMISVPPLDPAVPKPEGGTSVPACGEPLLVPASFPQSIEAAIHKFANSSSNFCLI